MILIPFGLIFALIGVGNLITSRRHPGRPNARISRGLGYVGIVIGSISIVYGTLQVTGIVVPAPEPQQQPAGPKPANAGTQGNR